MNEPLESVEETLRSAQCEVERLSAKVDELQITCTWLAKTISRLCELQLAEAFEDLDDELERLANIYQKQKVALGAAGRVH